MELSNELRTLLQRFKSKAQQSKAPNLVWRNSEIYFDQTDVIDVAQIDFGDDETWLCAPSELSNTVHDLNNWLYEDFGVLKDLEFHSSHLSIACETSKVNTRKSIDTRTFTRPKKRISRPSIEKNEGFYCDKYTDNNSSVREVESYNLLVKENSDLSSSCSSNNEQLASVSEIPLHFDLTQPVSTCFFENIMSNSRGLDSFQNMSPPSLVNSMCSSLFAANMENSYMKNEPTERKPDYLEQVLLQDADPPLFQSFTGSCSSLNSDTPENFLKKTLSSFNGTLKISSSKDDVYKSLNNSDSIMECETQYKDTTEEFSCIDDEGKLSKFNTKNPQQAANIMHSENIDPNTITPKPSFAKSNNTFKKKPSVNLNSTYEKSYEEILNNTYQRFPTQFGKQAVDSSYQKSQNNINAYSKIQKDSTFVNSDNNTVIIDTKKIVDDFTNKKRLSYVFEDGLVGVNLQNEQLNCTFDKGGNLKRTSLDYQTGSADSLDRISSLSNSSRESNRMLNMAEVDAIVEMQEQSLQIMSTPLSTRPKSQLLENIILSPIHRVKPKECLSESDVSSADESGWPRNSFSHSNKDMNSTKQIKARNNEAIASNPRSINTITKGLGNTQRLGNIRGSYSNLKSMPVPIKSSYTNLKAMNPVLKGSYTNLRPVGTNLPHAPKVTSNLLARSSSHGIVNNERDTIFTEVSAAPNDTFIQDKTNPSSTFAKPQGRAVSALPRPVVTGIPRPASRIPGPTIPRPATSRPNLQTNARYGHNDF